MTITPELEARILRLHHVEKLAQGHHRTPAGGTVTRVLAQAGLPRTDPSQRRSPLILETLQKYPNLTASRLSATVCERGYRGSPDHFRHVIACLRPRPSAEAYLRLRTLPAEMIQCDWEHFNHLNIGRARRLLMAFVVVLSYSREIFLRFFLDARMENFLRGHVAAFSAWNGWPQYRSGPVQRLRVFAVDAVEFGIAHRPFATLSIQVAIPMSSASPRTVWRRTAEPNTCSHRAS